MTVKNGCQYNLQHEDIKSIWRQTFISVRKNHLQFPPFMNFTELLSLSKLLFAFNDFNCLQVVLKAISFVSWNSLV